jgi:hypothetical protein
MRPRCGLVRSSLAGKRLTCTGCGAAAPPRQGKRIVPTRNARPLPAATAATANKQTVQRTFDAVDITGRF